MVSAMTGPLSVRVTALLVCLLVAQHSNTKKRTRQKRKSPYSRSERNAIIDSIVHPLANEHWTFMLIDPALQALNEQDPVQSFIKFLRYNAPELLKKILKEVH
jgi:hypothetical protein